MGTSGATETTADFLGLSDLPGDTQVITMQRRLLGGGSGSLFGGVGIAAALLLLERTTGQAPVYMTCQFASTVVPPAELVFVTEILAKGRTVSQGRITGVSSGATILTLLGATGDRTEEHKGQWDAMPDVPEPETLEPLRRSPDEESLHDHTDVRMVRGAFGFAPEDATGRGTPSGDNNTLFWIRMPNVVHDAASLALMADYLPSAIGNAMGRQVFASSLDNTVRFPGPIEPDHASEWVLAESHVEFVGAGFAVNRGLLWRRDGTLLLSANQSVTVATPRV